MKINIISVHPVYSWNWNVPDDELCGICRVSFDGTCPNCLFPGDGCPLVIGTCQHAFHLHCIQKWLQTQNSKGLCPMCRQVFTVDNDQKVNDGVSLSLSLPSYGNNANSDVNISVHSAD